jgi:hypothetical protein
MKIFFYSRHRLVPCRQPVRPSRFSSLYCAAAFDGPAIFMLHFATVELFWRSLPAPVPPARALLAMAHALLGIWLL